MRDYKQDYSIFNSFQEDYKIPLVYLDSAATSLTPDCVVAKMSDYYSKYRSNIDRSDFVLSKKSTEAYENARIHVSNFVGASKEEIFFTSGATDAANKLVDIWTNVLSLSAGDKIAVSALEHHSVYVPIIKKLKKIGIHILHIEVDSDYMIDIESYKKVLEQNPKLVFVQHINNVVGVVQDINLLAELAHKKNTYLICDGSQAVGHIEVDVKSLGVDSYFWSAHKMCGPTGIGAVYVPSMYLDKFEPTTYGGGAVISVSDDSVSFYEGVKRFEPGTQNIAGVIGFGEATAYLSQIGVKKIHNQVSALSEYTISELSKIDSITIYSSHADTVGIISFAHSSIHTHDISYLLGKIGIAVRSGYHCAEPFVRSISQVPVTRISLYIYNTKEDIDILIKELQSIFKKLI